MEDSNNKGTVCVTGGTGFLASWLIMRLLQHGYSVNTTIRSHQGSKKDVSYLTSLPGASEKLRIFNADLDKPESFDAAIRQCVGVFHVAQTIDFCDNETQETQTKRSINGALGILQSCLDSKTVKRVVYTSSAAAVECSSTDLDMLDEDTWSDVDFIRRSKIYGASYMICKTLTGKAALEFGEKHGLDVVSVIPTWINGPFLTPHCPGSVGSSLSLISKSNEYGKLCWHSRGNYCTKEAQKSNSRMGFVHTDDVARSHIFLFEYPHAKGRYICSAVETTVNELSQFLSARYPEHQIPVLDSMIGAIEFRTSTLSSKKLLVTGFRYKYGLEEMYDEALECCKQQGILYPSSQSTLFSS